jgi:hypothetical protein
VNNAHLTRRERAALTRKTRRAKRMSIYPLFEALGLLQDPDTWHMRYDVDDAPIESHNSAYARWALSIGYWPF